MLRSFLLFLSWLACSAVSVAAPPLVLPEGTAAILDHIYEGKTDAAIAEARELQQRAPGHPLPYILEAEAMWWRIWCLSSEYKYGMSMPRRREKAPEDQAYMDLAAKAFSLAETKNKQRESADMYFYAGMALALEARLYGLRAENRSVAHAGVRARENFVRALTLDPTMADAEMGLGLYDYYVDTLSGMARMLRFFMGIPGGSKADGIRRLERSIEEGQITSAESRFYLAINLHNYDQKYDDALALLNPLVRRYPRNPLFLLAQGDLYGKLGRNALALAAFEGAVEVARESPDRACQRKIESLAQQASAAVKALPAHPATH